MRHFRIRTAGLSALVAFALIAGCRHSTETTAQAQAAPATAASSSDSAALASAVDDFILFIIQLKHTVVAVHCWYKRVQRVNNQRQAAGKPLGAVYF